MNRNKKRAIGGAAILVFALQFQYVFTGYEHWPFLGYPMFDVVNDGSLSCPLPMGVEKDTGKEFLLRGPHVHPVRIPGVRFALEKLDDVPQRAGTYDEQLAACGDSSDPRGCTVDRLYKDYAAALFANYQRARSRTKGPDIEALRLYRLRFELEPATGKVQPNPSKTLLKEFRTP